MSDDTNARPRGLTDRGGRRLKEKAKAKKVVTSEQDKLTLKRNEEIRRKSTKETQDIKEDLRKKEQLKEGIGL